MKKKVLPANAGEKQDSKFKPGQSGNPAGKRPGTRHKSTMLAMAIMENEIQGIVKVLTHAALSGDLTAAALVLNKLIPNSKDMPTNCKLPKVKSILDLAKFTSTLLNSVASGKLGPSEAEKICKIVTAHTQVVQVSNFEQRIADLENAANIKRKL